jgi:predicted GIY-YIG superfamily endonuclease
MRRYVYLIQSVDNGLYKIGISKNPKRRLLELQTGNGEKLKIVHLFESEHPTTLETALHNRYSHISKRGEWFNFDLEIEVNFLSECKKIDDNIVCLKKNSNPFI